MIESDCYDAISRANIKYKGDVQYTIHESLMQFNW